MTLPKLGRTGSNELATTGHPRIKTSVLPISYSISTTNVSRAHGPYTGQRCSWTQIHFESEQGTGFISQEDSANQPPECSQ